MLADYALNWQKNSAADIVVRSPNESTKTDNAANAHGEGWQISGVAHFTVNPIGAKSCIIAVPENCELLCWKDSRYGAAMEKNQRHTMGSFVCRSLLAAVFGCRVCHSIAIAK